MYGYKTGELVEPPMDAWVRNELTNPYNYVDTDDPYWCIYVVEALMGVPMSWCTQHGWQTITSGGEGPGFTGARIYWWTLACGCSDGDFSRDTIDAAR